MQALYEFMAVNLTYQTPPGTLKEGTIRQHVKYGREVLRNRAGTCIDLAIFYGSVCEAVGLKTVLFVIPGHCFPAVKLPGGGLVAVEATAITGHDFRVAIAAGLKNLKAVQSGETPSWRAEIEKLHNKGVQTLDLPALPPSALNDWGIRRARTRESGAPKATLPPAAPPSAAALAGRHVWVTEGWKNGKKVFRVVRFNEDGTQDGCITKDLKAFRLEPAGRWTLEGTVLSTSRTGGTTDEKGAVVWVNENVFDYTVRWHRSQPRLIGMKFRYVRAHLK
jgi:hypothetical protein